MVFTRLNLTNVGKANYEAYQRVNVIGTKNVIKAVNTKHFVLMSTAMVYKREGQDIDESSPIDPPSDYAKSKWEAEQICRKYFTDDQLTILRAVNVSGPGQAEKAVIPIFLKKALNNEPIELIHPKDTLLQFLYVDDVVEVFQILLEKGQGCGVMNLASEVGISLEDLAKIVVRQTNSSTEIKCLSEVQTINVRVVAHKAKVKLGWQAKTSVQEIVDECRII
ncbi:hypothetical protein MNBD_UNCLBAC01-507 [hydrothermal vent metagenome]|uniref:NAD-dependent epimerase/dehydratase domain-containing protein n=1 Tax=hydrothermal vent metagenome TaxID=652676 RepID=A0A3B1DHZ6_9ZZZZ